MRNVLIIENDREFRESIKKNVKLLGYNVSAVKGSKEAENVLKYQKQVDLVIINYETLGMSGQDLANWVLQNCSRSEVVITHHLETSICTAALTVPDEVVDKSALINDLPGILDRRIGHPDPLSYSILKIESPVEIPHDIAKRVISKNRARKLRKQYRPPPISRPISRR